MGQAAFIIQEARSVTQHARLEWLLKQLITEEPFLGLRTIENYGISEVDVLFSRDIVCINTNIKICVVF